MPIEGDEVPKVASVDDLDFGMAYDRANLYLKWSVSNQGPLKNTGVDFPCIFKTSGHHLDLQMSTDPAANAARTAS